MKLVIALTLFVAVAAAQENVLYKDKAAGIFQPLHVLVSKEMASRYAAGFTDDDVAALVRAAEPKSYLQILGQQTRGVLVVEPAWPSAVDFRIVIVKDRPGSAAMFLYSGDGKYNFTLARALGSAGDGGSPARAEEALNRIYGDIRAASLQYMKSHAPNSLFYYNDNPAGGYLRPMFIYPDAAFNALADAGKVTYADVEKLVQTSKPEEYRQEFMKTPDVTVVLSDTVRGSSKFQWILASRHEGILNYWLVGVDPHTDGCPVLSGHVSDKPEPNEKAVLRYAAKKVGRLMSHSVIQFAWEGVESNCLLDQVK